MRALTIDKYSLKEIKNYLRVEHDHDDILIKSMMEATKDYIKEYTGLEDVNKYPSLCPPFLMLIGDMYENRIAVSQHSPEYLRKSVESFLSLHDFNFIPEVK